MSEHKDKVKKPVSSASNSSSGKKGKSASLKPPAYSNGGGQLDNIKAHTGESKNAIEKVGAEEKTYAKKTFLNQHTNNGALEAAHTIGHTPNVEQEEQAKTKGAQDVEDLVLGKIIPKESE